MTRENARRMREDAEEATPARARRGMTHETRPPSRGGRDPNAPERSARVRLEDARGTPSEPHRGPGEAVASVPTRRPRRAVWRKCVAGKRGSLFPAKPRGDQDEAETESGHLAFVSGLDSVQERAV